MLLRYLLVVLQLPLSVTRGLRNRNKKMAPVGRSFIRFPIPENVLPVMVLFVVVSEVVVDLVVVAISGCFPVRVVTADLSKLKTC